ncbi:MAG: Sec-independent protein translocase protein TatC [bacterium]|nr:MAG: Sec-independent protein translocase protein TatC [bacterium]
MTMIKKLDPGEKVPFTEHLEELRRRIITSIVVVGSAFVLTYSVSDRLLSPLAALVDVKLVFIAPTEAFFVNLKVAFYTALAVSAPLLFYQTWAFVAPGLLEREKKYTVRLMAGSTLLFAVGVAFCFYMVLPLGLKFLIGYGGDMLLPMLSVGAYLGFCLKLMLVFGIVFQLPLVVAFLYFTGITDIEGLIKFRGYLVVGSFILAAVVTPPDVFTQVVLALPLIILYELSLITIRIFGGKKIAEKHKA